MSTRERLDGIQVARGLAALGVALFHSDLMIRTVPDRYKVELPFVGSNGGAGVYLFFVISGFIIAKVVTSPSHSTGPFFVKRFFRIYPPYIAVTLGALVLQLTIGTNFHPNLSPRLIVESLAIWPIQDGPPYFQVGWSLEHEVLFYLIVGLLVPFVRIEIVGVILTVLSLTGVISDFNLYFVVGIAFYLARRYVVGVWSIVLVAIVIEGAWIGVHWPNHQIAGYAAASVALCALLMKVQSKHVAWRALVSLGDVSFSLYLVHWLVFRVLWQARMHFGFPDQYAEVLRWTGIALAIGLSYVFYRWVEMPSMRLGARRARAEQPTVSVERDSPPVAVTSGRSSVHA